MKKNVFFFFVAMVFPINVLLADWPGQWPGKWNGQWEGRATEKSNYSSTYGTLSVTLKQTDTEYTLEEGVFSSRGTQKKWGPDVYTIQDNKLYSNQKEVGSISDKFIHVMYEIKNATGTIFIEQTLIRVDEDHIHYQEQYLANKMVLYGLSGTLIKTTQ